MEFTVTCKDMYPRVSSSGKRPRLYDLEKESKGRTQTSCYLSKSVLDKESKDSGAEVEKLE